MTGKKLLIFGISGLTGYKIAKAASTNYDVFGTYNERKTELPNCTSSKIDITNQEELEKLFSDIKPDIAINTTALHNVDFCEEHQEKASLVNSIAVKNMRQMADSHNSKLVHISTDYVFDGKQTKPYTEKDTPQPISFYGESKLNGEKSLEKSNHIILRPSVVYGWTPLELAGTVSSSGKPMNFAMWLLTKLHKKEPLKIVTDQFATATLADTLADSAIKLAESNSSGVYHVSGLSCESRFEFSQKLARTFGYDENKIQPTDSSQFKQKAKRPKHSCLDCTKAMNDFNLNLLKTEDALEIMKSQVEKEEPNLLS